MKIKTTRRCQIATWGQHKHHFSWYFVNHRAGSLKPFYLLEPQQMLEFQIATGQLPHRTRGLVNVRA